MQEVGMGSRLFWAPSATPYGAGRNGAQNLWPPSRSAPKADLNIFPVLTTVFTSTQRFWPLFLPAIKRFCSPFLQGNKGFESYPYQGSRVWGLCLPLAPKCLPIVQETPETELRSKKRAAACWIKRISSTTVPYHYLSIDTSFYPPSFSSDTTFKYLKADQETGVIIELKGTVSRDRSVYRPVSNFHDKIRLWWLWARTRHCRGGATRY